MKAAGGLRLFMLSVHKSLCRRARDHHRRYCSARATPTGTGTATEEESRLRNLKTKLRSGPGLTDFIKDSSSNKKKVPEVYEYEEPYLPGNFAEANLRKGERTC